LLEAVNNDFRLVLLQRFCRTGLVNGLGWWFVLISDWSCCKDSAELGLWMDWVGDLSCGSLTAHLEMFSVQTSYCLANLKSPHHCPSVYTHCNSHVPSNWQWCTASAKWMYWVGAR
jgi:hypothetical protein